MSGKIVTGCLLAAIAGLSISLAPANAQTANQNGKTTQYDSNTRVYLHMPGESNDKVRVYTGGTTVTRTQTSPNQGVVNVRYAEQRQINETQSAREQQKLGELKSNGANVPKVVNIYVNQKDRR